MTLRRCFLLGLCIVFPSGSYAQESPNPLPDAREAQKPVAGVARPSDPAPDVRQPLLGGSKARLALLSQISSKSPSGSSFMAKLEDLVEVDGKCLLPKGTLVEGHLETVPARRPMRRGALRMVFDRVKLPDGTVLPARFQLFSIESDSAKTDSEGTVHPTVSKKRLALQLGGNGAGGEAG